MGKSIRVLIVEDSAEEAERLILELRRGGFDPEYERVETPEMLGAALDRQLWDVAFGNFSMPTFGGVAALKAVRGRELDLPFIFVSGSIGEDTVIDAMRNGANDYILKDNLKRLAPAVDRELRESEIRKKHRQAEELVRYLAYNDTLTGLPNRMSLQKHLQQVIAEGQREKRPAALLLMDLDHFKEINDTLGHHRGDLLLQKVGSRIKDVLRPSDMVARLGGDEFAIVLPLSESGHATLVAAKIQKNLETPFLIDDLPIAVEVSIGISLFPDHGNNPESLMQRADVAMYSAKQSGGRAVIYSRKFDRHSPRRIALIGQLRQAIDQGQLFLHYQPKVDLKTNRIVGVEALVRWRHPVYGVVSPNQFIEAAERTGLIKPLTEWVFYAAMLQCQIWKKMNIELTVSVNLSARNLLDPNLPEQTAGQLRRCKLPPHWLRCEITESAIMADPAHAMDVLNRLREKGVRLSIDDFGTGYSSLSYLKKLPVDEIKVDKSFVTGVTTDENDRTIARSTIELGHNLGLKVVGEGVENKDTLDLLVSLGCDEAQGYYIGRPMSPEKFDGWLRMSRWGLLKEKP
jgi:diguanylate cyclase (GGDEF)-like protein